MDFGLVSSDGLGMIIGSDVDDDDGLFRCFGLQHSLLVVLSVVVVG